MYPAADRGRGVRLPLLALMEEKKYPEPVVGALVFNDKGRVLLVKACKWSGKYAIPGGKVEAGEAILGALAREVKEETNLEVDGFVFLGIQEAIFDEGFHKKKHFIFLDYACRVKEGEVVLNDEGIDFVWVRPEEALLLPLVSYTLVTVKSFIEKFPEGLPK